MDGIIGGTSSEIMPKPLDDEVMIAIDNVVAADMVVARLMRFNLSEIKHLKLCDGEI